MSGYATGSLTEAERKALFEAALEDQELFDELAGEQAVKEVLDEPGARQRLLAALEPPRRHRAWLWITAAVTLAIVIGVVLLNRTPPPQQIAQVMKSPEPVAAPVVSPVVPPAAAPPPVRRKIAPAPAPGPTIEPLAAAPAEPPAELRKEEEALADRLQKAKPLPQEAARGFVAGGGGGAARAANSFSAAVSTFAFNFTIQPDRVLQIVPAAPGFLSITAGDVVVFPSSVVSAGIPVRIPIPAGAASVVIGFSATPGITGTPVRRDGASGTVTDQDPPNNRILIQLFLTPATQ